MFLSEQELAAREVVSVDFANDSFGFSALANRGVVLGAAFFTLVSFIIIGIVVGAIVSKKLRRLHVSTAVLSNPISLKA